MKEPMYVAACIIIVVIGVGYLVYFSYSVAEENRELIHEKRALNASLENKIWELNKWKTKYNNTVESYERETSRLESSVVELENKAEELNETKMELRNRLDRKNVYHTPTPKEVELILFESDIDKRKWTEDEYVCSEFSYNLIEKFKGEGIFSCPVLLSFGDDNAHYLVAVNTTEGVKYVEPQDDTIFEEMEVGENYCDIVDWECDWEDEISKISSCYGILETD